MWHAALVKLQHVFYCSIHSLNFLVYADYVDDVFNKGALWQSDPLIKAQAKLLLNDYGNKVSGVKLLI